ncbi:hypothetical protein LCGC14_2047610 [marine sediment metagenome]|uniref:Uncharacterized protein n=1 Tax=marine sediment metagenome TaxID=412755 RepID=A0A0F9EPW4_9ZZZZ
MSRLCNQTAVYWGNPQDDGYGTMTYDDPVEIKCRWQEHREVISVVGDDRKDRELVSKAQVWVVQDVDEEGYLYLGTLDSTDALSSAEEADPAVVDKAYKIRLFEKTPELRHSIKYIRKAYL